MPFKLIMHKLPDQVIHPDKDECTQLMQYTTVMGVSAVIHAAIMYHRCFMYTTLSHHHHPPDRCPQCVAEVFGPKGGHKPSGP